MVDQLVNRLYLSTLIGWYISLFSPMKNIIISAYLYIFRVLYYTWTWISWKMHVNQYRSPRVQIDFVFCMLWSIKPSHPYTIDASDYISIHICCELGVIIFSRISIFIELKPTLYDKPKSSSWVKICVTCLTICNAEECNCK